jgi:F-type H+-transporting ATPase subunit c
MKLNKLMTLVPAMVLLLLVSDVAFAQEAASNSKGLVGLGAGLAIGLAALGGGLAQGNAAKGMYESVARNPQAAGQLTAPFYVGMALIESLVIYALLIAFMLQGKIEF